mmetsp:Transcript_44545/g.94802  ORF Transcript_44545/g.94802 Transcript_44545/m.94802 type:complete len:692 (+) Transcript_44545:101-2176(+)|eukprot:CAMPEP_0172527188 /NCGR_PEP_ID=MMETSP1067-20121228/1935_1 /TAXON_ID=265564 ORGANISM="Thalassiosira punctigera, Strain Tpunct2005C2" /NCGR_SAMPLE_ID=MMETSP1067 /ASSEMBLY_ACC=CAM_ASM_000444 /LENGTH=691 /DNA_ID=CAMNT_0013310869 /DNA_START=70 /DNA_END=2145 /DNA_ORIENTATION=+
MVVVAIGAGLAIALYFMLVAERRDVDERQKATKEQVAKASFKVRRSQLMSISGRGQKNRRRGNDRGDTTQSRRHGTHSLNRKYHSHQNECDWYFWYHKLVSSLQNIISHAMLIVSFGYIRSKSDIPPEQRKSVPQLQDPSQNFKTIHNVEEYFDEITVVGLDCEMVGGGRGGWRSLLARCSVVTLDCIPNDETRLQTKNALSNNAEDELSSHTAADSLDRNLVVLYDKYVIPRGKITDYRTEWSGVTKDTYKQSESHIPIVSFHQCQNEILQLFSSIAGKRVLVVGHALENDFEALEIEHPPLLTRDTAFYPPYMRRVRRKLYPKKLSALTSEVLDIEIQQKSQTAPSSEMCGVKSIRNASIVGHSSVEDAAAALRLYWHRFREWERTLGYPLLKTRQIGQCWPPLKMYLDGCNLPIGMRGVNFKELMATNPEKFGWIASQTFRLTSRERGRNHSSNISTIDWIPVFQSAISPQSAPNFECISIMFDGAKFSNIHGNGKSKMVGNLETRVFHLDLSCPTLESEDRGSIRVEITENGDSADDVLFHRCSADSVGTDSGTSDSTRELISLEKAVDILSIDSEGESDALSHYVVIQRSAGGTKTHRRLFDKLHLRRPDEGALCLSALTPGLQKHSCKIIRELLRERGVEKVIRCELRRRDELRCAVVTDDVFLADRLVGNGVLVLSYSQLTNMF